MTSISLDTPLDVETIRADFPVLAREVRPGVPLTYLDSAATSQKPLMVIDAMDRYYRQYNANIHRGIHTLSEEATEAYEGARRRIQQFINAASYREVIYTRNATESINLVAQTWGRANLKTGDAILTTEMEHHANIVPWQILASQIEVEVRYARITDEGRLDMDSFHALLDDKVKLVAVAHKSNVLGIVNPIPEIVSAARAAGAIVLLDGAQSTPHLAVDVQALDADFFVFSAHKMLGPAGIGILYGKRDLLEAMPPFMGGGDMIKRVTLDGSQWNDLPWKFEAGTPAIADAIGLGAAIDYLSQVGLDSIYNHEAMLTHYALERLLEIPGLQVLGPEQAQQRAGLVAFRLDNIHPHDVSEVLNHYGIAVRAGHHCAMPLHLRYNLPASTRASFYLYTAPAEIDRLVDGLYQAKKLFS